MSVPVKGLSQTVKPAEALSAMILSAAGTEAASYGGSGWAWIG
jgi:hypothetical protein